MVYGEWSPDRNSTPRLWDLLRGNRIRTFEIIINPRIESRDWKLVPLHHTREVQRSEPDSLEAWLRSAVSLYPSVAVVRYIASGWGMIGEWWFGSMRSWLKSRCCTSICLQRLRKTTGNLGRAHVPAEIPIGHLPTTDVQRYRYANPLRLVLCYSRSRNTDSLYWGEGGVGITPFFKQEPVCGFQEL